MAFHVLKFSLVFCFLLFYFLAKPLVYVILTVSVSWRILNPNMNVTEMKLELFELGYEMSATIHVPSQLVAVL